MSCSGLPISIHLHAPRPAQQSAQSLDIRRIHREHYFHIVLGTAIQTIVDYAQLCSIDHEPRLIDELWQLLQAPFAAVDRKADAVRRNRALVDLQADEL